MPYFTKLNNDLFAIKRIDLTDDVDKSISDSRLHIVTWEDETFYYLQNPEKVKNIYPIYFQSHRYRGGEESEKLCDFCSHRNRLILTKKSRCDDCFFNMAPSIKKKYNANDVIKVLLSCNFEEMNAFDFYHSVFKRVDSSSWIRKQFDLEKIRDKVRIHSRGLSFPLWRFSKNKSYLNMVHPYISYDEIPETTFVKTNMHRPSTTERNIIFFDYLAKSVNRKSLLDDAFHYVNAFEYSIDINDKQFPISIPYQYDKKSLIHLTIDKVDELELGFRIDNKTTFKYKDWLYELAFPSLEKAIEHFSKRTFTKSYYEEENRNYLFDGHHVYEPIHPVHEVRFIPKKDHYGNHTIHIIYYEKDGCFKTFHEAKKHCLQTFNDPDVFLPALLGYEGYVLSVGDQIFISNPKESHEQLKNQIGTILKISKNAILVGFLNDFFKETFHPSELTLMNPNKN